MTFLFGYVDCGGVPFLLSDEEALAANTLPKWTFLGRRIKDTLRNWVNCHHSTTDTIVFNVMGPSPLPLNDSDTTYYFEPRKYEALAQDHLNIMSSTATKLFSDDLDAINLTIAALSGNIEDAVVDTLIAIDDQTNIIVSDIESAAVATLTAIDDQTMIIVSGILNPIEEAFIEVIDLENIILSEISTLSQDTLSLSDELIDEVSSHLIAPILVNLKHAADLVSTRLNDINTAITGELAFGNIKLNEIVGVINRVANTQIGIAAAITREIELLTTGLPAGFDTVFRDIGNDLLTNAGGIFDKLINVLLDRGREKIDEIFEDFDQPMREMLDNIFKIIEGPEGLSPAVRGLTNKALHNPLFPAGAVLFTIVGFIVAAFMNISTKPEQELLLQEHSKVVAWAIPPIDVLISGKRREFLTDEVLTDSAKRLGYDDFDIGLFEKVDKLQFDSLTIIELWRRNFITEVDMFKRLEKIGYEPDDQDLIKAKSDIIPGVGDLIRFMVRDVFSPEVTARFGQFEDFPPQFEEFGKQIGLNTFWAQNYWAAHWELPGIRLAFEMLHRDIINQDDLDILLKAKDIMPFWREPIKAVAFRPFTRVDIRRMHKLKVLTDDELLRAYKDLGYDEDKAGKLAQFTIDLNFPKPFIEFDNPVETPQHQIEGFLQRGVINGVEANNLLVLLGYEQEDADTIVRSIDLFDELIRREEKSTDIIELATVGSITFEQAEDTLFKLNFETEEVTRILDKITTERGKRLKVPDVDALNRMLRKNLIDKEEYLAAIQNAGYSKEWADRFLKLK